MEDIIRINRLLINLKVEKSNNLLIKEILHLILNQIMIQTNNPMKNLMMIIKIAFSSNKKKSKIFILNN